MKGKKWLKDNKKTTRP